MDADRPNVPSPAANARCVAVDCAVTITTLSPATELEAAFWGGFVAAEGCFTGAGGRMFQFAVELGASDQGACHRLRSVLGIGRLVESPKRQARYDDEVAYIVNRTADLLDVIVPFMDEHLPDSYKRTQYLAWRARLLKYWEHDMRRCRPCTVEGCTGPQRAKGLCRHHYYQEYRR
jgi:hypothetical protein